MGRVRKQILALVSVLFLIFQFASAGIAGGQASANSNGDLAGVNFGDFIALQWSNTDGAARYYLHVSTTSLGPWTLIGFSNNLGGAKIHETPAARRLALCYRVEATNANGAVIYAYEPICVPRYSHEP